MEINDSNDYRSLLEDEILKHTTRRFDLLIEEDLEEWATLHDGDLKGNPPAAAVVDGQTGNWGILLRRKIDQDWVASIIGRIEFSGFSQAGEVLNSPEIFLKHLVLHELAHLANNGSQGNEELCDGWAFEKLGIDAF